MACSKDTNPPAADQEKQSASFQLGIDIMYCDGQGNNIPVVYGGASAYGFLHTDRFEAGAKLTIYYSNLQLLDQPDFLNMSRTPLDYINEVGTGLLLEEAQYLARPLTTSPLQQQLMRWHHRLYHLP